MSLSWTIDPDKQLIEIKAGSDITRSAIERFLKDVSRVEVAGYRKLFDGTRADTKLSAEELLAIGGMFRDYHAQGGPLGPVAVIGEDDKYERFARLLGILASGKRPFQIFRQADKARRWLMMQPAA
jgi:hypothetical protein